MKRYLLLPLLFIMFGCVNVNYVHKVDRVIPKEDFKNNPKIGFKRFGTGSNLPSDVYKEAIVDYVEPPAEIVDMEDALIFPSDAIPSVNYDDLKSKYPETRFLVVVSEGMPGIVQGASSYTRTDRHKEKGKEIEETVVVDVYQTVYNCTLEMMLFDLNEGRLLAKSFDTLSPSSAVTRFEERDYRQLRRKSCHFRHYILDDFWSIREQEFHPL